MPVYNGEKYLPAAVESILNQSFHDFEFLIVDDGSTDNTWNLLQGYASTDSRIRLMQNPNNIGLVRTLNLGLQLACGKFVARMDADDISLPERFRTQVEYMESHPEVGVLGTNVRHIDAEGNLLFQGRSKYLEFQSRKVIRWTLLWKCTIYHPTVMLRRELLENLDVWYDPAFETAEDYELWTRLARKTVIDRLPDVLLHYRVVSSSISRTRTEEQKKNIGRVIRRELRDFLGSDFVQEGELEALLQVFIEGQRKKDAYRLATDVVLRAHASYTRRHLSEQDCKQIDQSAAELLRTFAMTADNSWEYFFRLFAVRRISMRELASVTTAKRLCSRIVRSVMSANLM